MRACREVAVYIGNTKVYYGGPHALSAIYVTTSDASTVIALHALKDIRQLQATQSVVKVISLPKGSTPPSLADFDGYTKAQDWNVQNAWEKRTRSAARQRVGEVSVHDAPQATFQRNVFNKYPQEYVVSGDTVLERKLSRSGVTHVQLQGHDLRAWTDTHGVTSGTVLFRAEGGGKVTATFALGASLQSKQSGRVGSHGAGRAKTFSKEATAAAAKPVIAVIKSLPGIAQAAGFWDTVKEPLLRGKRLQGAYATTATQAGLRTDFPKEVTLYAPTKDYDLEADASHFGQTLHTIHAALYQAIEEQPDTARSGAARRRHRELRKRVVDAYIERVCDRHEKGLPLTEDHLLLQYKPAWELLLTEVLDPPEEIRNG